jgi:2'-5' RNA ligase
MRLFVAIDLNEDVRTRIAALRDALRARSSRGKFARKENIHLTMAFIGECDAERTERIKDAMDSLQFGKFPMTVDRMGRFRRDGGDVWWLGISGNEELQSMRRDLVKALANTGIGVDERYDPHITIGREVHTDERPHAVDGFTTTVDSMDLMRSERIDGVLTYTSIHTKRAWP